MTVSEKNSTFRDLGITVRLGKRKNDESGRRWGWEVLDTELVIIAELEDTDMITWYLRDESSDLNDNDRWIDMGSVESINDARREGARSAIRYICRKLGGTVSDDELTLN